MEKIEEGFALCFRNYYNFFLHFPFRMVRYEHYFVMKEIFGVNLAKLNNVSGTGVKSLKKKYDFFVLLFKFLIDIKKKKISSFNIIINVRSYGDSSSLHTSRKRIL